MRRQWAAAEAMELAWGGISHVANATGISRTTILAGIRDLKDQESLESVAPPAFAVQVPAASFWSRPIPVCGMPWTLWSIP